MLRMDTKKKNGGGYCIIRYDKHYNDEDPRGSDHVEPWVVSEDLIECIATFYKENSQHGVQIIKIKDNGKDLFNDTSSNEGYYP
jgi:hypothetical protein